MSDWESDDGDYDRKMAERNWNRLQDTHGTLGYTEGLVEGKDAHIQRGFDDGYESAAIIARELGRMRGILEYRFNLLILDVLYIFIQMQLMPIHLQKRFM
ncbi:hypothetical protein BC833DRAFT_596281, partial [Globomyces pollinis-pini]